MERHPTGRAPRGAPPNHATDRAAPSGVMRRSRAKTMIRCAALWVTKSVGYDRLVLSACNPLYSAVGSTIWRYWTM